VRYGLAYHHANGVVSYGRVVMTKEEAEIESMEMQMLVERFCESAHTPHSIVKVEPTRLEI